MAKWWDIRSQAGGAAEVWLYGIIGEDIFSESVSAKEFVTELRAINASEIHVHINSPGGSVFDGVAIYNLLTQHGAEIVTYNDAEASSIASVIMLAGSRRVVAKNAMAIIHDPWAWIAGNAEAMRKKADMLDKVGDQMLGIYTDTLSLSEDEVREIMAAETLLNADEMLAYGFATEIAEPLRIAALASDVVEAAGLAFTHRPHAEIVPGSRGLDGTLYELSKRQSMMCWQYQDSVWYFGKFDQTTGPDGSHYLPVAPPEFMAEGLVCGNCALYDEGRECDVVEGDIDPYGICKLWVIPGELVGVPAPDGIQASRVVKASRKKMSADATAPADNRDEGGSPTIVASDDTGGAPVARSEVYVNGLGYVPLP